MKKTELKIRIPLIFAAIIFAAAASDAFINQNIWWGTLNLFVAIANLFALKIAPKYPELTTVFLGILNALIAFLTAWIYIEEGKQYIQFVWVFTGIIYLVVSYLFLNKAQKKYM
ncbi:MAG: hypothetical protein D8M58_09105 [Calditrichaeota bacterium]|nr:MAG: hypothetical protein DWQ03_17385 [Calditrichota bacterium]MBL1205543.1 hypothetical protein [Calditrichota bacterium]NOG45372.1 hypothetical protein [Calditrichota bacterium]